MLIYIRGAGDLASGIALRLHHAGMQVVMSELKEPMAVRRTVSFSEAMRCGSCTVEEIRAKRAGSAQEARALAAENQIAVVWDPGADIFRELSPDVLVDAIMAKKNLGTSIGEAPVVIGVGPGFTAGVDCHAVIETKRGHTLGRVIRNGSAIADTGIPGVVAGFGAERVLRAPADGIFRSCRCIGDLVQAGETVGYVGTCPMPARIPGMIRGLLQDGVRVSKGLKCGDVDPRGKDADFKTVSDKSLAIGGGVLEAVLWLSREKKM